MERCQSKDRKPYTIEGLSNNSSEQDFIQIELLSSEKSLEPEIYDSSSSEEEEKIIIKKFYDYRPQAKREYFTMPKRDDKKEGISAVIPFFNEESYELQQTLNSLYDGHIELKTMSKKWQTKPLYICLIQDGWQKASESMKIYIKHLFPKKINGEYWWDYFEELKKPEKNENVLFIIERKRGTSINPQEKYKGDPKYMNITLVIKGNNRRKHNSHEWFLGRTGFAEATNAKYVFLTDAFTIYSKKCIYYLVKDLDKNKKLSGVTGRQRLMTRGQQGSDESVFSLCYVLRMLQLFDFELSNAVYNGAFSLGGLLPVIPGPCGLYRASAILQDNVRDTYFNIVNEEPLNTGLVLGNLRIAEDRILTIYSVLKTETYLSFNPLALFYFEAETDLQRFMLQRRRWINGSVAGYIYLLFQHYTDYKEWKASTVRKCYIWLLLLFQFIIYCMVAIVPGISLKTLYYGLEYYMNYYQFKSDLALTLTFIVIWGLYVSHVFIHNKNKFNYLIMYVLIMLSLATTIISYSSLFHYAFIASKETLKDVFTHANPVLYMAIAVLICPFILSLSLSGRLHSVMYMIKSVLYYLLLVTLLVGWFGSYAYCRTWDLSWGNRPANELNEITPDQKKIMITKFKEKSVRIILLLIIINIAVFFIPLSGQLYLMATFFTIALIQMFFSFIYCLTKIKYKIEMVMKNRRKKLNNKKIESNA